MGTSLTVHPFASLAGMARQSCPRVLINLDHVGDFGSRADDVILLGKCDEIVTELCKELEWEQELLQLWEKTEATVLKDEPKETVPAESSNKAEEPEQLNDVTAKMAQLVVDAAESEGVSGTSAPEPSGSKAALNQPEVLEKAPPANEQEVSSKEVETPKNLSDGNLKL